MASNSAQRAAGVNRMQPVNVTSEVARLRKVLVHRPGAEIDQMVPSMMEDLLFDDILFGDRARDEHECLTALLEHLGVEVCEMQTLLEETLQLDLARKWLLDPFREITSRPLAKRMRDASAQELAAILVRGVRVDSRQPHFELDELFELPPLPNWCFQRDPQAVVGRHVVIAGMATQARWREALLAGTVFRFHPQFSSASILLDPFATDVSHPILLGPQRPHFEGGDILVLSREVVALGYSERTNRTGVQLLARSLARREGGPRWLVVLTLPHRRAFMHLDTVMTPVDRDACLVYTPILRSSGTDATHTFEIDLHSVELQPMERHGFLRTLKRHGVDLRPIPCGGTDPMQQQREQWTDGANALAVAPGIVLMYDRNIGTNEELAREGFAVLDAKDVLSGAQHVDISGKKRACILLPSYEMSRARGGPHCLAHPLVRDDIDAAV